MPRFIQLTFIIVLCCLLNVSDGMPMIQSTPRPHSIPSPFRTRHQTRPLRPPITAAAKNDRINNDVTLDRPPVRPLSYVWSEFRAKMPHKNISDGEVYMMLARVLGHPHIKYGPRSVPVDMIAEVFEYAYDIGLPLRSYLTEFMDQGVFQKLTKRLVEVLNTRTNDARSVFRVSKMLRIWYHYFPDHIDEIVEMVQVFFGHLVDQQAPEYVAVVLQQLFHESIIYVDDWRDGLLPKPTRQFEGVTHHPMSHDKKKTVKDYDLLQGFLNATLVVMTDLDLMDRRLALLTLYGHLNDHGFNIEKRIHLKPNDDLFRLEWVFDELRDTDVMFPLNRLYFPETSEYKVTRTINQLAVRNRHPKKRLSSLDAIDDFFD